ncbi:DUF262 domain-containing protein [Gluconobacter japonicus]|uniref:DUF262 domain-containing protein n=1 Tax=Gluconobacter japonicus TaxID=376620 RepID=UPI0024ACDCEE|nr:DUF262 domain-containing protein [Gluconobacter japonicus]MDI6653598.1 DUF262 domain-containing protein [Gluconobacter japonicus]
MMENINNQVLSVRQLLALTQLSIPTYQRPYRWGARNIADLFTDLATHQNKSAYRLGSVVFYQHTDKDEKLDIVDGQQRTLTLMLTVKVLIEVLDEESRDGKKQATKFQRQDIRQQLEALREPIGAFMERTRFSSRDSEVNLRRNYLELHRRVARSEFDEQKIDFLLNKCQVVCFVLEDISEAFQFFDSQNARGRDLAPHDLLKAFHLREFAEHETYRKAEAVAHWERLPSNELAHLFAFYLYRVRQWAEGKSARYFGKGNVKIFKGVNLERVGHFPYVESLRIAHHFVDDYNSQYQRKIDGQRMVFPFHLDQMIINGRRFFEMAEHYQKLVAAIVSQETVSTQEQPAMLLDDALTKQAGKVLFTLNHYARRHRTGDRYVRAIFDCALIFYIDKFGSQGLSLAIEKCFIWAYRCRIRQQVVQLATMDNYVLEHNLIRAIRDAHQPSDLQAFYLPNISRRENRNNRNGNKDELVELFQEMNYYV